MTQSSTAIIGKTQLFREGLQILLRRSRFVVTVNTTTISAAVSDFAIKKPDLAVCAVPSNDSAADWIGEISRNRPEFVGIHIVLLTDHFTEEILRDAAAAGVNAILSYDITGDVFQRSLELVALGQQLFPSIPTVVSKQPSAALIPFHRPMLARASSTDGVVRPIPANNLSNLAAQDPAPGRCSTLSNRERQILCCLVEGAANKTIARDLEITEATVKVHIKGLLRKIKVSNRTQAAVWGLSNKWLLEDPKPSLRETASRASSGRQVGP